MFRWSNWFSCDQEMVARGYKYSIGLFRLVNPLSFIYFVFYTHLRRDTADSCSFYNNIAIKKLFRKYKYKRIDDNIV